MPRGKRDVTCTTTRKKKKIIPKERSLRQNLKVNKIKKISKSKQRKFRSCSSSSSVDSGTRFYNSRKREKCRCWDNQSLRTCYRNPKCQLSSLGLQNSNVYLNPQAYEDYSSRAGESQRRTFADLEGVKYVSKPAEDGSKTEISFKTHVIMHVKKTPPTNIVPSTKPQKSSENIEIDRFIDVNSLHNCLNRIKTRSRRSLRSDQSEFLKFAVNNNYSKSKENILKVKSSQKFTNLDFLRRSKSHINGGEVSDFSLRENFQSSSLHRQMIPSSSFLQTLPRKSSRIAERKINLDEIPNWDEHLEGSFQKICSKKDESNEINFSLLSEESLKGQQLKLHQVGSHTGEKSFDSSMDLLSDANEPS